MREALFPHLWRAISPDGRTTYEVTIKGADKIGVVPGLRLQRIRYRTWRYWRWWFTHSRFSFLDLVAILIIVRVLQQIMR
jgi:hypothetical protein